MSRESSMDLTARDAQRFRLATLRAKLTRMRVVFETDADEEMLERLVRFTEQRLRQRRMRAPEDDGKE